MCQHSVKLVLCYLSFELMLQCYSFEYPVSEITKPTVEKAQRQEGWIDPFDMSSDGIHSYDKYKSASDRDFNIDPNSIGWKDLNHAHGNKYLNKPRESTTSEKFIIYQQFINVFLKAMALKDAPEIIGSKLVQLDLVISGRDLQVLQGFGSYGAKEANVEQVSKILNKIFSQSQLRSSSLWKSLVEILQWLGNAFVKLISSPEWTITTSMLSMVAAVLWLVFVTRSFRLAFFCTFFLIFIAGFGFNWMRMYEEKEIERYYDQVVHGDAPYHCKGRPLTWYQTIYYYWFGENCLKFYKRRDVRPFVKVSPSEVLSVTISTMIIEPARNIAKAYSCFINEVVCGVSWYLKPVAILLAFIMPPVFLILILAFFFNYQLSFFPTGVHLLPSWSCPVPYRKDEKYIEDLSNRPNISAVPSCNSCQSKGLNETALSNCKTPLVLMNLSAVKSFFSNLSNKDSVDNNKTDVDRNASETGSEEAVQECSEEVAKGECGSCKKRTKSIYTSVSGSSSRSSDEAKMILSGGDGDQNCIPETVIDKGVYSNKSKIS